MDPNTSFIVWIEFWLYVHRNIFDDWKYKPCDYQFSISFLQVIIEIIKQNPAHAVESISVYCLSFLIKHSTSINFHPNLLLEVVELCLDLLEKYPNDMTVHKYVLIILQQQYLEVSFTGLFSFEAITPRICLQKLQSNWIFRVLWSGSYRQLKSRISLFTATFKNLRLCTSILKRKLT